MEFRHIKGKKVSVRKCEEGGGGGREELREFETLFLQWLIKFRKLFSSPFSKSRVRMDVVAVSRTSFCLLYFIGKKRFEDFLKR
jgi:hypothetical protein